MNLPDRWSRGWAGALILCTLLAYLPVLVSGGWIWDDDDYVTENPILYQEGGLSQIWTDPGATPQYYPVVHTTFWLEVRLWGTGESAPAPFGMHFDNVLLMALTGVLLWRLLLRLGVPGAWFAAALFVLHPVHVETVAWVTERKNLLSGVFALATALSFWNWIDQRRLAWLGASFALFALGLLSKSVIAFVPPALLLLLWWRNPGALRRPSTWVALAGLLLMGVAAGWHTAALEVGQVGAEGSYWQHGLLTRLLLAAQLCWVYLWHGLWPFGHVFFYPRWELSTTSWSAWLALASTIALLAVLACRSASRGPLVAILIYGGALFPALGFFDVYPMKFSWAADHFQYHADFALCALFAAAVKTWLRHWTGDKVTVNVALAFLLLCGVRTALQGQNYRDQRTLWTATTKANPGAWAAWQNLGQLAIDDGDLIEGERLFRHALRLQRDPVLLTSLAVVNLQKFAATRDRKAVREAYALANEAVTELPIYPKAQAALGHAIVQGGGANALRAEQAYQAYFDHSLERLPAAQRAAFVANSETGQVARNLFRLRLQRARRALDAGRANEAWQALRPSGMPWDGGEGVKWRDLQPWNESSPWAECEWLRLWILAAHADPALRDPATARDDALALVASMPARLGRVGAPPAVILRQQLRFREIAAAAQAHLGSFDIASSITAENLAQLGPQDRGRLAPIMEKRLAAYQASQPFTWLRDPDRVD